MLTKQKDQRGDTSLIEYKYMILENADMELCIILPRAKVSNLTASTKLWKMVFEYLEYFAPTGVYKA